MSATHIGNAFGEALLAAIEKALKERNITADEETKKHIAEAVIAVLMQR